MAQTIQLHIDTQTGRLNPTTFKSSGYPKTDFEENTFSMNAIPSLYTIVYVRKLNDSVRILKNDNK